MKNKMTLGVVLLSSCLLMTACGEKSNVTTNSIGSNKNEEYLESLSTKIGSSKDSKSTDEVTKEENNSNKVNKQEQNSRTEGIGLLGNNEKMPLLGVNEAKNIVSTALNEESNQEEHVTVIDFIGTDGEPHFISFSTMYGRYGERIIKNDVIRQYNLGFSSEEEYMIYNPENRSLTVVMKKQLTTEGVEVISSVDSEDTQE